MTAGSKGPTLISCTASYLLSSVRSWHTVVCLSHEPGRPQRNAKVCANTDMNYTNVCEGRPFFTDYARSLDSLYVCRRSN